MIVEGIIINKNHDLIEICIFPQRKNEFTFLPDKIADSIRLGQRVLFRQTESSYDVLKGF